MTSVPGSAAELIVAIVAAGNELTITDPKPAERAAWRRVIYELINSDACPPGTRVRHTGRDHGDLAIRLVPDTAANEPRATPLEPIPIPTRLTRPHPLIAATRDLAGKRTTGWVDTRSTGERVSRQTDGRPSRERPSTCGCSGRSDWYGTARQASSACTALTHAGCDRSTSGAAGSSGSGTRASTGWTRTCRTSNRRGRRSNRWQRQDPTHWRSPRWPTARS